MRKTTPRSECEDIPGFDRTERKYIRLDGDAWLVAHRIQEEGARRGKRNQPGANEALPDGIYRKIESWIRKRALDCKEEVGKYINDELANLHELGSSWEGENPEIDLDALVTQRCQDLRAKAEQSVSELDKQRAEYEEAARDLKNFRQRHQLSRVAHYPSSQVAHWLWVPVAMIVESFVSANLLGSVSRGGVIEGWMVALVLTFVNVLLGIWAGRTWRFTHYGWGFVKLLAFVQGLLCAGVALGRVSTNEHYHVNLHGWNSRKLNTNASRHTSRCSAATSPIRTSRCSTPSCMSPNMAANGAGYRRDLATGTPSTSG